tara:strand:+ start:445 stop:753 length:309 start_codon:yes stop_codon:yes gene_type:complete
MVSAVTFFLLVNAFCLYGLVYNATDKANKGIFLQCLLVLAIAFVEAMVFYIHKFRRHWVPYMTPKLENKAKILVSFFQLVRLIAVCLLIYTLKYLSTFRFVL